MAVRTMREEDCASVAALCGELGYPSTAADVRRRFELIRSRGDHAVFVAEDAGRVIGWLHVGAQPLLETDLGAEILGLVVAEDRRGHGVGGRLIEQAEAWSRRCGCERLRVRSRIAREGAHAFYERVGFGRVKTQHAFEKRLDRFAEGGSADRRDTFG